MNRNNLDKRLRELGIYSDFYMRRELKALPQLLEEGEQLNCVLTGVHEAERKMLAVTDRRLIVIFAAALSPGAIKVIPRDAVGDWHLRKSCCSPRRASLPGAARRLPLPTPRAP